MASNTVVRKRRKSSDFDHPNMSELRIVVLGKNVPETSRVGNFILGRKAFKTEAPPPSVEQHSERARGQVEGRYITLIHTPHLFNTELTQEELNQRVKECVTLSAPGPHVFLLVLQSDKFTKEDQDRIRRVLNSYGPLAMKHSVVLTTDEAHDTRGHLSTFLRECGGSQHMCEDMSKSNKDQVLQLLKKIDQVVEQNGGLTCEMTNTPVMGFKEGKQTGPSGRGSDQFTGTAMMDDGGPSGRGSDQPTGAEMMDDGGPSGRGSDQFTGTAMMDNGGPSGRGSNQFTGTAMMDDGGPSGRGSDQPTGTAMMDDGGPSGRGSDQPTGTAMMDDGGPSVRGPDQTTGTEMEDDKGLRNPCRSLDINPPNMSELRIVVLGKNVPETSRVGNFILGRDVFKTEAPPPSVGQHSERARGQVEGRYITLIHTPCLFHAELTQEELNQRVKECVTLSAPGPHVIALIIQPDNFTKKDRNRVHYILKCLSEDVEKYSLVITLNTECGISVDRPPQNIIQEIIAQCKHRHFEFNSRSCCSALVEMMERIVKENEGDHFIWEEYEETLEQEHFLPDQELGHYEYGESSKQETHRAQEKNYTIEEYDLIQQQLHNEYMVKEGTINKINDFFKESVSTLPLLNLVLCGRDGALKASISDLILGQREQSLEPISVCVRREGEVCGHLLTLVEMPALYKSQLSEEEVMRETLRCVSLCDPGVHAFLFIIHVQLSAEDKGEMEKIQEIFSSQINDHTMVLITTVTLSDTVQLSETMQVFIDMCTGRHHVMSPSADTSVLLQKVEQMVSDNNGSCYNAATYLNTQMETGLKYQEEMRRHICELKSMIQRESQALTSSSHNLRIVLLGKTGVGKSATGNTILRKDVFKEDEGYESITRVCQIETAEVNGRQISVIDTPGLFDTELDNEEIKREISKCISMILPGPHVFLLVLKVGQRFSKEERQTVTIIQDIFGEGSINYTIVVFTREDELKNKTIEQYFRKPGSEIMNLIEQCGNRYHVLNNKNSEDHTQVSILMDKIDTMVTMNGGRCYTNEMFQQIQRETQKENERIMEEMVEQIKREKEDLKIKYEKEIEWIKQNVQDKGDEKKRLEEEFCEKEKQLRRELEENKKLQVLAVRKEEESKKIRKNYEKIIEEKEKKMREMDMQRNEFEKQKYEDQLRRGREETERSKLDKRHRKEREEFKAEIQELKRREQNNERRREKEENKRSELEEKLKQQQQLQVKLKEELKCSEQLVTKHQQEIETWRKTMEKEQKSKRDQEREFKEKINKIQIEEVSKQNVLEEKLKHAKDIKIQLQESLQEEKKIREKCQNSLDTIMQEGRFLKSDQEENNKHRKREIEAMKNCIWNIQQKRAEQTKLEKVTSQLPECHHKQLIAADVMQVTKYSQKGDSHESNVIQTFLNQLLRMDYRARYFINRKNYETNVSENNKPELETNPMDVQMAVFHCSDSFLKQLIVTKLSQCQYALPLLVPDPFTREIEFPLWTFRQIKKSWKTVNGSKEMLMVMAETPMVAFFRLGSVSSSKSQLINSLINDKHKTFFNRHCPGSSKNCLLMDGVVEIAWYFPSGNSTDHFPDCVAFCNLHGDAAASEKQYEILTKMAAMNVVLFPDFGQSNHYKGLVKRLFSSTQPLICLLADDNSTLTEMGHGKYSIGLKDRNENDLSQEIKKTIAQCLSVPPAITFKLEDLAKYPGLRIDEDNGVCKTVKQVAFKMMDLLKGVELSLIKDTYLPCQGKKWHEWCQKNKELHRWSENEKSKSNLRDEMKKIRKQQQEYGVRKLMDLFIKEISTTDSSKNMYLLKWIEITINNLTSDHLCKLQLQVNDMWSNVSKKNSNESEQKENEKKLEKLLEERSSASFGLENILREMGQIYESYQFVETWKLNMKKKSCNSFPTLAAQLMISGQPMELMDGDAGHVPLVWVSAVLDELIKILGDQRVFVLSVLGIQSSGKSTMLNAMFGLQFAVSAGRCTRGAFMQLVKISEEMKTELKFDYILIVDTEGLRAPELSEKDKIHHDNELATFVVGLGNMTLVNIFGENPSEMQDILQIVVQVFLRMKMVRLNPSCMFVHQNVPDVTAAQKNMEGRRRLLETLDGMTKVAAQEECCDAECFDDVIAFKINNDVRYFAQLWEGSPPMAPQNPQYSENIEELRNTILSHASKCSILTLSMFKTRLCDLWNALLHENFVFSFRNTLEIAEYRKLEEEYGKWTWSLRSAMLKIKDKLQTRINNNQLNKVESSDVVDEMKETYNKVQKSVKYYFEKEQMQDILQQWRGKFERKINELHEEIVLQAKGELNKIINQKKAYDEIKSQYEAKLFEKSKELALDLKRKDVDETELKTFFDSMWGKWISELTPDNLSVNKVNIEEDIINILSETYERNLVCTRSLEKHIDMSLLGDYTKYVKRTKGVQKYIPNVLHLSPTLPGEEQDSIRGIIFAIISKAKDLVKKKQVEEKGYNSSYIQELVLLVKDLIAEHKFTKSKLIKEFSLDLSIYVCNIAAKELEKQHMQFRKSKDPVIYLEKMKPEYYSVFQKYFHGATSTVVFGSLICSRLGESVLQSVYNTTANFVSNEMMSNVPALNGNRSNLEKHILVSLAEDESFEKFKIYLFKPQQHFENVIKDEVQKYMTKENLRAKEHLAKIIADKKQCVITAANDAIRVVTQEKGNVYTWMKTFSDGLKDELEFNIDHMSDDSCHDISDFQLLTGAVKNEISVIAEGLNRKLNSLSDLKMENFRKTPDDILIEHFCRCCWVQCPFCKAICTNTVEDHDGDHSVPFHRADGINGWTYRRTTNLSTDFCTTVVQSKKRFYPNRSDWLVPYKQYRTAGDRYAKWSITPDNSELPYWKWFVCRFQKDLEDYYKKTFEGSGQIPDEWKNYAKKDAIESLDKYM